MNCNDARHAIVLEHYGELSDDEQARLDEHLRSCQRCDADREETRRVLRLVSAQDPVRVPDFDRERSWRYISARMRGTPSRRWFPLVPGWRWGLVGAGLLLAAFLGIVIGRLGVKPSPEPDTTMTEAAATKAPNVPSVQPMLVTHLEDLRPILLDFANSASGAHGATITVDERLLRALLLQNLLLRRALEGKDPAAAELLDDLDLILKEIVNGRGPGSASQAQVRDLIRDREILFRIQILRRT
ncbi:MAG: zf-HC2 domain-containing protein [Acidobacteriota bacterium]